MEQNEKNVTSKGDTGKGTVLKRLNNITCPYTGIRMISGGAMNKLQGKLDECRNLKEKLYLLSKYARNMQPVEHRVFDHISYYLDSNPDASLSDCLSSRYEDCLTKLKLEEFRVIDNVDRQSTMLSTQTQLALRAETTNCRTLILDSNEEVFFKRKSFLVALENIKGKNPYEERVLADIRNLALFLPTSGSSENAFIVKYSRREEREVLIRIMMGSVATIEHVLPHSTGGKDTLSNFLLVSNNGNKYRENIPLTVYIDRNPAIPELCQIHIEEIISSIHKGAMKGNECYPYQIKKTLFEESEGRILLDLSSYRYSEEKAQELERQRQQFYQQYSDNEKPAE